MTHGTKVNTNTKYMYIKTLQLSKLHSVSWKLFHIYRNFATKCYFCVSIKMFKHNLFLENQWLLEVSFQRLTTITNVGIDDNSIV